MNRKLIFLVFLLLLSVASRAQEPIVQKQDTITQSVIVATKSREASIHVVDLKKIPFVYPAGEPDAIKFVQTLPGIATGVEGSAAFYARGGNYGNNIVSLDGTTLYGSSHLLGLTTVVPTSIVGETRFQIGGFSGEDANFTASIVELQSKDGDMERTRGAFSVSTTMVGGEVSVPLVKGKASILAAGRFAPLGWEYGLVRPLFSSDIQAPDTLKTIVADAFAKFSLNTRSGGLLHVSGFYSMDAYRFSLTEGSDDLIRWQNLIGSAHWQQPLGERTIFKVRASINDYNSLQAMIRKSVNSTTLQMMSALTEGTLSAGMEYIPSAGRTLRSGLDVRIAHFNPGAYKQTHQVNGFVEIDHPRNAQVYGLYAEWEESRNARLNFRAAVRGNLYHADGYTTFHPELRTMLRYYLTDGLSLQMTFDETVQYYHTLEGLPTGWSLDMKVPSSLRTKPERSSQLYGGVSWEKGGFHAVAGMYGKYMRNLIYFANAADFFGSAITAWEEQILTGNGQSYGMELQAGLQRGRLDASLAYTLSKTDRTFPGLNESRPFPAKFDRRHILSLNGTIVFGSQERLDHGFTTLVSFYSGHMESLKSGVYQGFMPGMEPGDDWYDRFEWRNYYSHPNNYRMPYYFRWDIGYYLHLKGRRADHRINAGIYNVTNRHNAATLFYDEHAATYKQLSIFPLMPSLNYTLTF